MQFRKDEKKYSLRNRHADIISTIPFRIVVLILLGLNVAMFADVLFTSKTIILSQEGTDLSLQFIFWRKFGFEQLKQGNLALWNPYSFSGTPFLGMFQSALLYPFNLLYLVLPLSKAVNFSIVLHVFLLGIFIYLWTHYHGLHTLACLFSSVLIMFSGAHFMHIYAGHLSALCTMIWMPLLFLSIDGLFKKFSLGWCLLGILAITMQLLAGHPQYLFYTTVCVVIYYLLNIFKTRSPLKLTGGLLSMYAGAFALGAVQILTGIQMGKESLRSSSLPFEYASTFSFPPENLITFLTPGFFGNMQTVSYWGRWYLWEMLPFISITGLFLAIYGSIYGKRNIRFPAVIMMLLTLLFALGAYTPLFSFLYHWIPGFDRCRASCKFIFHTSVFLAILAGIGLDYQIKNSHLLRRAAVVIFAVGILLAVLALCIRYSALNSPQGLWQQFMFGVYSTHQTHLSGFSYVDEKFVRTAGLFAAGGLLLSGGTCILLSLLCFLTRFSNRWVYAIVLLATAEVFIFARTSRATFDLKSVEEKELKKFAATYTDDVRILYLENPNSTMSVHIQNIWGYDPSILRRYAQFIRFTQGYNIEDATEFIPFRRLHRLFNMLRCRYALIRKENKMILLENKDTLPHLYLVQDWLLKPERKQIFAAMREATFDPWQTVILEEQPEPEPIKSEEKGFAQILDYSTDHLTIEANLPHPAILLITDAYSNGWNAKALSKCAQKKYKLMPANYILRAIPLSKGYHLIRLQYLPRGFQIGKWISLTSLTIYLGLLVWYGRLFSFFIYRHRKFLHNRI